MFFFIMSHTAETEVDFGVHLEVSVGLVNDLTPASVAAVLMVD